MNDKGKLMKVIRKPPVEIEFNNISFATGNKEILHSVSGKFSPGQLVAILGASGAGKTTLLNVLTGQLLSGVSGEVLVNQEPRNMRKFRKISAYLMQEDLLQPLLSVKESMTIAAHLKLGNNYSREEKAVVIQDVLGVMGLEKCLHTKVENLSGGERKRLTIALELINNPPIIFLDEPTTGLDNVAMKNCVEMLKSLTNQGRTIICTIHQPSDSVFKLFDIVYFLSEGYCIYNGTVDGIVPYLSNLGFDCPLTYSPSDYILEILYFNPTSTGILSKEMQNGKTLVITGEKIQKFCKPALSQDDADIDNSNEYPVSFFDQFRILLYRKFIQLKRNKVMLFLEMLHHLMCGLFLGMLFYDVGNSGVNSYANVKLYFGTIVYLMYTHMLSPILVFPEEVKLLHREYFNRWYSLKAYFLALSVSILPTMILTSFCYLIIVYPMTGQPMESDRFFWFLLINIIMSLTADGFGYAIGSILSPWHGATLGSAISVPIVLIAVYNIGHADQASEAAKTMMSISFPYNAWVALTTSMLNGRQPFECEDIFCYFGDPKFLLKKMGMDERDQYIPTLVLVGFLVAFKLASYVSLRFRLSQKYSLIEMKLRPLIKLFNLDQ
ncbi:ATP-binding cassette subfamily G member 4-like [Onthophagus taurus]|uniref:ATP-binding cassette subfamily G member 4-like n=1 Tax=Onthophagus taurus TaxID=166361 RepID=UPI0039BE8A40